MKLARVTKVYRDSSQERQATEYNGAYAVDVVFVDSKLADTEEECKSVFLAISSENDFSYPDEGSIVAVGVYENTSISYVDHITPFGKLVPGLLPGQRQIGDTNTHILVDTDQSNIEIEADKIRIEGDDYKNTASDQESSADQLRLLSEYIAQIISKGDIELTSLALLNLQAGRFSISGVENSTITATQALDIVVGLVFQIVTGGNFSVISQAGSAKVGNLQGTSGVETTGHVIIENLTGGTLRQWLTDTLNAIETGIVAGGGTFNAASFITLLNLILK